MLAMRILFLMLCLTVGSGAWAQLLSINISTVLERSYLFDGVQMPAGTEFSFSLQLDPLDSNGNGDRVDISSHTLNNWDQSYTTTYQAHGPDTLFSWKLGSQVYAFNSGTVSVRRGAFDSSPPNSFGRYDALNIWTPPLKVNGVTSSFETRAVSWSSDLAPESLSLFDGAVIVERGEDLRGYPENFLSAYQFDHDTHESTGGASGYFGSSELIPIPEPPLSALTIGLLASVTIMLRRGRTPCEPSTAVEFSRMRPNGRRHG